MADVEPPRVPFRVTDPERIPTPRYYDAEFYRAETERLWPHVWQMACRVEQVQNVGDYIVYENLGKSVIVVHTKDGIKAFHNACRHRGVALAKGSGNCKREGFICPFHGWRWNTEGQNTFVYGKHLFDEAKQLDGGDLALPECRSEVAIGCVFINFDDDAPSYRETIGPLIDRLEAHNLHKLRAEWSFGTVLPANWKVAMEAFMEGYHVMRTHPQLHNVMGVLYNSMYGQAGSQGMQLVDTNKTFKQNVDAQIEHMELLSDGMAGMLHKKELDIAKGLADVDIPGDDTTQRLFMWLGMVQAEITRQLGEKGEPVPDLNALVMSDPIKAVEFLFPNYFLLPYFSSFSAYRIRPLGPESCLFELWSLTTFPEGQEPDPVMVPTMLPYDSQDFPPIPRQDYENIPRQQIGLHAEGFDFMRLAKNVEGMISNYQRIIDGHLGGVDKAKLAVATNELAGNFDGQIKDFDF